MAEYAGYVRRETPIDWNSVAGDIVNQLGDVRKEQAATRKANDELAAETYAQIGKYEAGQSPQLNELAYNMITQGRSTLDGMKRKLMRGEITQDAFNRANMSMQTQNQEFKDMLSSYNTSVMDIEKGISDGTLSNLNNFNLNKFKDLSDLSNKQFQWVPKENGIVNMYVNTIDKDGNTIKNPQSLGSIKAWEQKRYAGYDLDSNLNESVKTLAVFDIGRERDKRLNPEYERTKEAIIEQTLGDDERIATILADYDGYAGYEEGQQVPEKGIKMVLQPNGSYKEEITPELRKRAREIVEQGIERRLGKTLREAKPSKIPKGKYTDSQINTFQAGYDAVWKAANAKSDEDFKFLDRDNYKFKLESDGTITVTDNDAKIIHKNLKRGSEETAEVLSNFYTEKFGPSAYRYIHKQVGRKGEVPQMEITEYSIAKDPRDIEKITSIQRTSNSNLSEAQQEISSLINKINPTAVFNFEELDVEGTISKLPIIIKNPEGIEQKFIIQIDDELSTDLDVLKQNEDRFQNMVNYSMGIDVNVDESGSTKVNQQLAVIKSR